MKNLDKNHIFSFLDTLPIKQQNIVVGVSGGPDSMLLAKLIQEYFTIHGIQQEKICIAHFNHGQRKESKKEQKFILHHFEYNTIYWNTNIPKKGLGETKLRDLRHIFFEEVIQKTKASYLFLGHNLTDRIETSLMHMVRGSSLDGILSIKHIQKKKNYTIVRPLLDISKKTIQNICDSLTIPYFIDATNNQGITPRNTLRNEIIPLIQSLHTGGEKNWNRTWFSLYNYFENTTPTKPIWNTHTPNPLWNATKRCSQTITSVTPSHLFSLFKDTYYATTKTIESIQKFLDNASGYMFVGGWYLFIVGKELHCINGSKDFWKQKHSQSKKITPHGKQDFNGYTFTAPQNRKGCIIRYPMEGDIYKKKRLLKYMLNKKVPVFMRNTTPVIVYKNKIVAVLVDTTK